MADPELLDDLNEEDDDPSGDARNTAPLYRVADWRQAQAQIEELRDHLAAHALNSCGRVGMFRLQGWTLSPEYKRLPIAELPQYGPIDLLSLGRHHGAGRYRIKMYYSKAPQGEWYGVEIPGPGAVAVEDHASSPATVPARVAPDAAGPVAELARLLSAQIAGELQRVRSEQATQIATLRAELLDRSPATLDPLAGLAQLKATIESAAAIRSTLAQLAGGEPLAGPAIAVTPGPDWEALIVKALDAAPTLIGALRQAWDASGPKRDDRPLGELYELQIGGSGREGSEQ